MVDLKLWSVAYAHNRQYEGTHVGVLLVVAETQDGAALTARDDFARRRPDRRTSDYVAFGEPDQIDGTEGILGADGRLYCVATDIVTGGYGG